MGMVEYRSSPALGIGLGNGGTAGRASQPRARMEAPGAARANSVARIGCGPSLSVPRSRTSRSFTWAYAEPKRRVASRRTIRGSDRRERGRRGGWQDGGDDRADDCRKPGSREESHDAHLRVVRWLVHGHAAGMRESRRGRGLPFGRTGGGPSTGRVRPDHGAAGSSARGRRPQASGDALR